MTPQEQKKAAKAFVKRWKEAEGNEQREANKFWIELFQNVLGVQNPTLMLDFERKAKGRRIDVFHEDMGVLIENKSRGVSLDEPEQRGWIDSKTKKIPRMVTPYQQAKGYADDLPYSVKPRWLVTCNFDEIRVYDQNAEYPEKNYEYVLLDELPEQYHRLLFMVDKKNSRLEREKELSVQAGEVVGKLYDAFAKAYLDIENDKHEQRSLNILITRIVFLLFAEDADLLHERDAFYKYLKGFQVHHMRQALIDLFAVLKTPVEERDPYLTPELSAFPYVNGGLFEADIVVPQFTEDSRFLLLREASADFDWSHISPTIFGAVFESTLNPETRRAGGMHYTSIENIHKVTGPLFYDDLVAELTAIEGAAIEKERKFKLNAFRKKIASIRVLDPACGSGNFLTETYIGLRKLENRVLEDLYGEQMGQMVIGQAIEDPVLVSIDQFYGIEINDFAVEVAKTALWIAELQMLDKTREILSMWIDPLPLETNDNLICANALRMDWGRLLPAKDCGYIIGNPPFVSQGSTDKGQTSGPGQNVTRSQSQNEDVELVFGNMKGAKELDYVACWFKKAFEYAADNPTLQCGFVSTNSICQGQQVEPLWKPLLDSGLIITFAHQSFVWMNEATDKATVYVVIIGFSRAASGKKLLYRYSKYREPLPVQQVDFINAYLAAADNVIVQKRSKPLSPVPEMTFGNKPTDGGNLLLSPQERRELIAQEPESERWIRRFISADGLLKNKEQYCLWMEGIEPKLLESMPLVKARVDAVREMRAKSTKAATRKKAETPWLFDERRMGDDGAFIVVPLHSTGTRKYVPMVFSEPGMIPGNSCSMIPDADIYLFGVLMSWFHNVWIRAVAGRFGPSLRYANTICYNTFVFPTPTPEQCKVVEVCAQAVLDAREAHPDDTLADLYDPDKMPDDLLAAHKALDAAVEAAYGVDFNGDEEKIVAHLFRLYAERTKGE